MFTVNANYDSFEVFLAMHNQYALKSSEKRIITHKIHFDLTLICCQDVIDYISEWVDDEHLIFSYSGSIFIETDNMLISIDGWEANKLGHFEKQMKIYVTTSKRMDYITKLCDDLSKKFEGIIIPSNNDRKANILFINSDDNVTTVEKPVRKAREFNPNIYPNLGDDPSGFIDNYITSEEPILILIGEPGMGKSSLICEIINRMKSKVFVAYDHNLMIRDETYITSLYNHENSILILEDADVVMKNRENQMNLSMSRILNMSDGIVSNDNIKIIMTANISDKKDIDPALLRPGRCYALVEFKHLDYDQANTLSKSLGKELYTKKDYYTVAEIYNSKNTIDNKTKRVGFI